LTRHYVDEQRSTIDVDLGTATHRFSIPTSIEESYREDVKRLFCGAAAYAVDLERWLKDDLITGLRLSDLRQALQEARLQENDKEEAFADSIITESAATGHARLLGLGNGQGEPRTVLTVNVGAGFTDFSLFSVSESEGGDGHSVQLSAKGGVGTGLSVWDNTLKTLIFNRVRETPAVRKRTNEFKNLKARLELGAREIKEALIAGNETIPVSVLPVLPDPLLIERSELEGSLPVKAALFGIRDSLRVFLRSATKAVGINRLDPQQTEVLVTGGGAFLPSVLGCIREAVATLGPAYPNTVRTDCIPTPYASIPNIAHLYPLLAVSLGSTEKRNCDDQTGVEADAAPIASATPLRLRAASQSAGMRGSGRRSLK
jgi:hypothetical protein